MSFSKKLILGAVVIGVMGFGFFMIWQANFAPGAYDEFAKCLSSKGVKMYGAFWCPHCQNQKKMFGNSWKYMTYVECSTPNGQDQTQQCKDSGIDGYPTWEFQNGKRISGELTLQQLASNSQCTISKN